jgi:hypothetical protein
LTAAPAGIGRFVEVAAPLIGVETADLLGSTVGFARSGGPITSIAQRIALDTRAATTKLAITTRALTRHAVGAAGFTSIWTAATFAAALPSGALVTSATVNARSAAANLRRGATAYAGRAVGITDLTSVWIAVILGPALPS